MLSADDIDALLTSVTGGMDERKPSIPPYDWKHPLLFTYENLRVLGHVFELWGRFCSQSLTRQLETPVRVTVASIDQLGWEVFLRSLPGTSLVVSIAMDPMKGSAFLQFDPALTLPLIERLLGGQGEPASGPVRELTLVEQNLLEALAIRLLGNLREAWSGLLDLRPRLVDLETQPSLVKGPSSWEPVALVTLLAHFGEVEGRMHFCLPWSTAAAKADRLTEVSWQAPMTRSASVDDLSTMRGLLAERAVIIEGDFSWDGPPLTGGQLAEVRTWQGARCEAVEYR